MCLYPPNYYPNVKIQEKIWRISAVDTTATWAPPLIEDRISIRKRPPGFLKLPIEIRNMILEPLIHAAISSPPLRALKSWQTPSLNAHHKSDVLITPSRILFRNLRLDQIWSFLIMNRQVYEEVNALLCSLIRHIDICGDFLLGLTDTQPIMDILKRRPWFSRYVRSVHVDLHLYCVSLNHRGIVTAQPLIGDGPKPTIGKGSVRLFSQQRKRREEGGSKSRLCFPPSMFLSTFLMVRLQDNVLSLFGVPKRNPLPTWSEHNTLPNLAAFLETFPQLEQITFETRNRHLLSFFPNVIEMTEAFLPLKKRGVTMEVLFQRWQLFQWRDILLQSGVNLEAVKLWHHQGEELEIPNGWKTQNVIPILEFVRFNLMDCLHDGEADKRKNSLRAVLTLLFT